MDTIELKLCHLIGNLASDRTSEQYPTEPVCLDCIAADARRREDARILGVGEAVDDPDAECYICNDA